MTVAQRPLEEMNKRTRDALVDQLRACHSTEDILQFEKWFNSQANSGQLYQVICNFLKNRTISRGLAAKWLFILLEDRQNKLLN